MNTMADDAAQRLVAQIGGMDLPELPPKDVVDTHLPTGVRIYGYTAEQMREYARASIAARQPVGATVKHSLTIGGGQAVGQEPVCFIHPRDADRLLAKEATLRKVDTYWSRISDAIPVYLGQPAQAVDLGQFRASVKGALIRMQQDSDTECAAHKRDLQRLLALIDSQAVGNK